MHIIITYIVTHQIITWVPNVNRPYLQEEKLYHTSCKASILSLLLHSTIMLNDTFMM